MSRKTHMKVPQAIDLTTYGRQRDKRREELTFAKIDHHPRPSMNST
jgi:hypothetical protein